MIFLHARNTGQPAHINPLATLYSGKSAHEGEGKQHTISIPDHLFRDLAVQYRYKRGGPSGQHPTIITAQSEIYGVSCCSISYPTPSFPPLTSRQTLGSRPVSWSYTAHPPSAPAPASWPLPYPPAPPASSAWPASQKTACKEAETTHVYSMGGGTCIVSDRIMGWDEMGWKDGRKNEMG